MLKLKDKVCLVTGGARGIGAAIVNRLVSEGAYVAIADILDAEGEALAHRHAGEGHSVRYYRLDVCSAEQWQSVLDGVISDFGRLDGLVNNAGIVVNANIEELSVDQYHKQMDVNVLGPMLGMQQGIARMKTTGGGAIVNMSSVAAHIVTSMTSAYGASKAAVANMTKAAAVHCAQQRYNIRINSVHPGPVHTPMLFGEENLIESEAMKPLLAAIPMGRVAQPEEIAGAVAFLLSDDASYMTGSEMTVDGGFRTM